MKLRHRPSIYVLMLGGVLLSVFLASILHLGGDVPLPSCYGKAEILLTDARLSGVPGLPPPVALQGELGSLAPFGEAVKRGNGETVRLFLPVGTAAPSFGSVMTVTGRMLPPGGGYFCVEKGKRLFREDGYAEFLRARRIAATFYVDRVERVEPPRRSFLVLLYGWRDKVVTRLLAGVRDPEIREVSAALTFGLTGGVKGELRRRYLEAGTVHLFSVSGMHVMLLAGLLTLLCRWLPFQPRQLVVAGGCFLYAAATGFNTPALRAFLLVAAWCILRSWLFFVPSLSILAAVGSILLLLQPQLVSDVGFQYTFLITAALLLYSRRIGEAKAHELDRFSWMAAGPERTHAMAQARRRQYILHAVGGAAVAFLAALPITLCVQGEVPPGALAANVLLVVLLPLIFPALLAKLLLGGCLAGVCIWEFPFRLLNILAGVTQEGFARIAGAAPSVWSFVLYEVLLLFVLAAELREHSGLRRLAAAGAALLAAGWFVLPHFQRPFLLIAHTGSNEVPQCAWCDPAAGRSRVLLFPGMKSARALAAELRRRGIQKIDQLYAAGDTRSSRLAVQTFTRQLEVANCVTLTREVPLVISGGGREEILWKKSGFQFAYPGNPCTVRNGLSCERSEEGWIVRFSGGRISEVLPFTSCPEVHFYE